MSNGIASEWAPGSLPKTKRAFESPWQRQITANLYPKPREALIFGPNIVISLELWNPRRESAPRHSKNFAVALRMFLPDLSGTSLDSGVSRG